MNKKYWINKAFNESGYSFTSRKVTYEKFIEVLSMKNYNLKIELGISAQSVSKLLKRTFPDRVVNNAKPCSFLLSKINKKICCNCDNVLDIKNFTYNKKRYDGVNSWCIFCYRRYQTNNSELFRSYTAERRSLLINRSVSWDQKGIKNFYLECPKGYHVDHIIPLKGKNVCGLHVLSNLQYLTISENLQKGNKY